MKPTPPRPVTGPVTALSTGPFTDLATGLATGLVRPTGGTVEVCGVPVRQTPGNLTVVFPTTSHEPDAVTNNIFTPYISI